jgi:hypothetical protein
MDLELRVDILGRAHDIADAVRAAARDGEGGGGGGGGGGTTLVAVDGARPSEQRPGRSGPTPSAPPG